MPTERTSLYSITGCTPPNSGAVRFDPPTGDRSERTAAAVLPCTVGGGPRFWRISAGTARRQNCSATYDDIAKASVQHSIAAITPVHANALLSFRPTAE